MITEFHFNAGTPVILSTDHLI